MKIVIINGSGESGKDEVVKISSEMLRGKVNVYNISSITEVKEKAKLFGWNDKKDDKGRRFLSDLKDSWTRYSDGPFEAIIYRIGQIEQADKNCLIYVHVREFEEIKKIVNHFDNVITLLIRRSNIRKFDNHADQEAEDYFYDYIIENSKDLNFLRDSVETFLVDIDIKLFRIL